MPKKSLNSVFPMNTIQNTAVSECYLTEMRSDCGWCKILIIKPWKHWALWFQVSSWPFCFCHLRSYKSNPVLSTEGIPTLPAFICHQIPSLHVSFHINSMGSSISICIPLPQSFKWQLMIYLKRSSHVNKVSGGFPFHCIDYKPLTGCMWSDACQPLLSPSSLSSQIIYPWAFALPALPAWDALLPDLICFIIQLPIRKSLQRGLLFTLSQKSHSRCSHQVLFLSTNFFIMLTTIRLILFYHWLSYPE